MVEHLYETLLRRAAAHPEAVAVGSQEGDGWKTLDSLELLGTAGRLAAQLAERGVAEGDRIILWFPSSWRAPVYLFALWKLGAIPVPFDRETNAQAASKIIASVEPRLIVTGYGEIPAWAPESGTTEWWQPETVRAATVEDGWQRPKEELAAIYFTSGTTGQPKGCMITHANLCSQVNTLDCILPLDPSCRLASVLPLSHLFELTCGLLYPLAHGAAIHYVPSRKGPDILRVLQEQRVTHMIAVPQLLGLMGKALDDKLRSSLPGWLYRTMNGLAERLPLPARRRLFFMVHSKLGGQLELMVSGAAALSPEVLHLWRRIGVQVIEGYGTSECSPVVSGSFPDGTTPIGSVGKPIRDVEVMLSPEGELLVRGPNVMKGYWKDPERTAQVLKDGWYYTGDLASIDQGGNIRLQGRAKDLIVLPSGMKVWPQDVEEAFCQHPAVKDAAVIPVPTPGGGARLHAYLLPAKDRSEDPEEIAADCNEKLALHQRVSTASWWPDTDFPRTSTLKVKRHLLPRPEDVPVEVTGQIDAGEPVAQAVMSIARMVSVSAGQKLMELGLDSMGLVQLALALEEKTGKEIADDQLKLDMTVGEVQQLVATTTEMDVDEDEEEEEGPLPPAPWAYTWGRIFRFLSFPFDLLYTFAIKKTIVLGQENLKDLPQRVIFAGTHHSYADVPLVRNSLGKTPAKRFSGRLVVAAAADGFAAAGIYARYGILAFGLYPLRRYGQGKESLKELVAIAEAGNAILVFSQGTHARPEQERAGERSVAFKLGTAFLAKGLKATVVPFGLAGTEKAMPPYLEDFHGTVIAGIPVSIKRVPLVIVYGAPMTVAKGEPLPDFTARLQEASYALTRRAEAVLEKEEGGA